MRSHYIYCQVTADVICGFSEKKWNEAFPGLSRNYFANIEQYCKKTNKDQVALEKEVMELSIEVARQIHDIGVERWLDTVKSEEVVSHTQTILLKQEVVDYSFKFREGDDLKKSLKL